MGYAVPKVQKVSADAVVLVKRDYPGFLKSVIGAPWVWDVVDAYPQPACTSWSKGKAVRWFHEELQRLKPSGVIFPNQRMADDCNPDIPYTVIYHHHRIDMPVNPIREQIKTVGYEGNSRYLGKWLKRILKECRSRGWEFRINEGIHSDMDICVAFRDDDYNGYVQSHWKSNVKLSNCHGSGTPFVGPRECGYTETACGLEQWVDSPKDLEAALDSLMDYGHRTTTREYFLKHAISVDSCRKQIRTFVGGLRNIDY